MKSQTTNQQKPKRQSVRQQKTPYTKIGITTIVVFIIAFLSVLLISSCIKAALIRESISKTNGSIYFNAFASETRFYQDEITADVFEVPSSLSTSSETAKIIQDYGGSIIGYSTNFSLNGNIHSIDQPAISNFLTIGLNKLSKTEIPIAIPSDISTYQSELDHLKKLAPDTQFTVVATIPYLNGVYLVDDGTDKIVSFLYQAVQSAELNPFAPFYINYIAIAKFNDYTSVQNFLKASDRDPATVNSPIVNTFNIILDFINFYNLFWLVSFILLLIVLIIAYVCSVLSRRQKSR